MDGLHDLGRPFLPVVRRQHRPHRFQGSHVPICVHPVPIWSTLGDGQEPTRLVVADLLRAQLNATAEIDRSHPTTTFIHDLNAARKGCATSRPPPSPVPIPTEPHLKPWCAQEMLPSLEVECSIDPRLEVQVTEIHDGL
jgi:hypothetical protein